MGKLRRIIAIVSLAPLATVAVAGRAAADRGESSEELRNLTVRVVDQFGAPQVQATAVACPYIGGALDCTAAVGANVNRKGLANFRVQRALRYSLFSFVKNPVPAWACPGFAIGDDVLYLSDHVDGTGATLPRLSTFVITTPSPADCVPVHLVDDAGAPLSGGVLLCAHSPGSASCVGDPFDGPDADGVIRLHVDPTLVYDVTGFITNSGWPCPAYTAPDGTLFHFSEMVSLPGATLIEQGLTLTIHQPSPADCVQLPQVEIHVVDDLGTPLPTAGLFVCAHLPGSPDCIGDRFDGPDADGVIRLPVDSGLDYDLGAFVPNTGWPCPYVSPDGTQFHFSPNATYSGATLLASGATFVVHHPTAAECP